MTKAALLEFAHLIAQIVIELLDSPDPVREARAARTSIAGKAAANRTWAAAIARRRGR